MILFHPQISSNLWASGKKYCTLSGIMWKIHNPRAGYTFKGVNFQIYSFARIRYNTFNSYTNVLKIDVQHFSSHLFVYTLTQKMFGTLILFSHAQFFSHFMFIYEVKPCKYVLTLLNVINAFTPIHIIVCIGLLQSLLGTGSWLLISKHLQLPDKSLSVAID